MTKTQEPAVAPQKEIQPKIESVVEEPQVAQILSTLPSDQRAVILAAIKQESFSGPLPHPQNFEGYEKVLPGSADRIIKMTESQVNHRINIEGQIVKRSLNQKTLGIIIGGVATVIILFVATYLALKGHDWLAGVMVTTTILGVITVFVLGSKPDNKDGEKSANN